MSGHAQEETDGVREHHQELKQRKAATETQDMAAKARKYGVRLGNRVAKRGGDKRDEVR